MDVSRAGNRAVIGWLQQQALPIRHLQPGNGSDDLQPLKQILRDVSIVGLGEATHGTHEFFLLKHRLLEFLVTELGYTAFAIEASHAACRPINDYVLHGVGERDEVLTAQGYLAWSMEEFSALLDWIRSWNESAVEDRKVRFWGTDVTYNEHGRHAVRSYLDRYAPERIAATDAVFGVLAEGEARWPMRLDEASDAQVREVLPELNHLAQWLNEHRAGLVGRSSTEEFDDMCFLVGLMRQWWSGGAGGRSGHMGRNLVHLIERHRPGTRVVYWGHNCHVGVEILSNNNPTAGHVLRREFGDAYYACALEFGGGSYQTRIVDEDGFMGDFKVDRIGPAQAGSLPWYLAQVGLDACFVDMRGAPHDSHVTPWFDMVLKEHGGTGWAYGADPETSWEEVTVRKQYDGVAFVQKSTPTHPTASALGAAARRVAL